MTGAALDLSLPVAIAFFLKLTVGDSGDLFITTAGNGLRYCSHCLEDLGRTAESNERCRGSRPGERSGRSNRPPSSRER